MRLTSVCHSLATAAALLLATSVFAAEAPQQTAGEARLDRQGLPFP